MTHPTNVNGFATIAQLIIVVAALLGVGAMYLLQTSSKGTDSDVPPRDKKEIIAVTDENFSELFYSLKRIDEVVGVYSPEEAIRGADRLHMRFVEIRGTVMMTKSPTTAAPQPGDASASTLPPPSTTAPGFVTPSGTIYFNLPEHFLKNRLPYLGQISMRGIFKVYHHDLLKGSLSKRAPSSF